MNKRKLYTGLIIAFLIISIPASFAIEQKIIIKKDTSIIIENISNTCIKTLTPVKEKATNDLKITDPQGIGMILISMSIIFVALLFLSLIFKYIGYLNTSVFRKKLLQKKGRSIEASKINDDAPGEVFAAIAMALNLYQSQLHDEENTVITMEKVARTYSPWSSKIYGLRQTPNNK